MESLVAIVCLITGSALTFALLGMIIRRGVRQLSVASAYRDVAQRLGLQVDTRGVSVHGHLGDRRIWIGEVMEAWGTERRVEVRGVLSLERPLGLGLHIRRRGRADRLLRRGRAAEVLMGDADLDKALSVHGDEPDRVKALFTPEVREAIRTVVTRWRDMVLTDDELVVMLRHPETSSEDLHHLVDAMVRAADAVEAARRPIPVPGPLSEILDGFLAMASALHLDPEPTFPAATGAIDGHRVLVAARREAEGYAAMIHVWFRPHPELGLLLRPQIEPDGYWSVGQDIQVGDAAFDGAFVIKGYDPGAVCARLSPDARKRLLGLRGQGTVIVDDRGLLVTGVALEPKELERAVGDAARAAASLGW